MNYFFVVHVYDEYCTRGLYSLKNAVLRGIGILIVYLSRSSPKTV